MTKHKFTRLLAAGLASLALVGCGGNDPDYGIRAPAAFIPSAGIAPPRFAYVVNSTSNNVSGFKVNPVDGTLTINPNLSSDSPPIPTPWPTGGSGSASMAVDAGVQFAYVVNAGSNNITVFSIATSGALTFMGVTSTGVSPKGIAVDPLGRYVYVVNSGDNTVSGYARNSTTGLLTALSPATMPTGGVNPQSITIEPSGKFVYVANFGTTTGNGSVSVFAIDTASGTAGQLIPVGAPITSNVTAPSSVAISPSGAYAYVSNYGGDNIAMFDIDGSSGALAFRTLVSLPPGGGTSPTAITVEPNGKYAYVSNIAVPGPGNVVAYQIAQAAPNPGSLTALSGAGAVSTLSSSGGLPYSVSADPSGTYVYAVQSAGGIINPFKIGTTGALTPLGDVAAQAGTTGSIYILITK